MTLVWSRRGWPYLLATGALVGPLAPACTRGVARQNDAAKTDRGIAMTATQPDDLRTLAAEVHLGFPPSSRLLGIARERGIDDIVEAKVQIASADLTAFLAHAPVKAEALETERLDLMGPDHGWWDPGRAKNLRVAQALVGGGKAFNLGVADGTAAGTTVLYIVQHGT